MLGPASRKRGRGWTGRWGGIGPAELRRRVIRVEVSSITKEKGVVLASLVDAWSCIGDHSTTIKTPGVGEVTNLSVRQSRQRLLGGSPGGDSAHLPCPETGGLADPQSVFDGIGRHHQAEPHPQIESVP